MNTTQTVDSPTTLPQTSPRAGRRWLKWLIGIVAAIVALSLIAWVVLDSRMNYVPPNLDTSTTRLSEQGVFRAAISSSINPIPINQIHTWTLHVETPDGKPVEHAVITVDGDMPQHGHGMPTKPTVTADLGGGNYAVEGIKFQMTGWWVVQFVIESNGKSDKVLFNLMLQ